MNDQTSNHVVDENQFKVYHYDTGVLGKPWPQRPQIFALQLASARSYFKHISDYRTVVRVLLDGCSGLTPEQRRWAALMSDLDGRFSSRSLIKFVLDSIKS